VTTSVVVTNRMVASVNHKTMTGTDRRRVTKPSHRDRTIAKFTDATRCGARHDAPC